MKKPISLPDHFIQADSHLISCSADHIIQALGKASYSKDGLSQRYASAAATSPTNIGRFGQHSGGTAHCIGSAESKLLCRVAQPAGRILRFLSIVKMLFLSQPCHYIVTSHDVRNRQS